MNFDTFRDWLALVVIIAGVVIVVRSQFLKDIVVAGAKLVWRKKYLWWIGFFAGFVAYGGEPDVLFRDSNSFTRVREAIEAVRETFRGVQGEQFLDAARQFISNYPWHVAGFAVVFLVLLISIIWLIVVAQAALVYISGRTYQKRSAGFIDGIGVGAIKFWKLFSITVSAKLATWAVWVLITGVPGIYFFVTGKPAAAVVATIGALVVNLPLSIIVSFLTKYAITYVTLQDNDPVIAIRNAWNLFKRYWLLSLEVALALYALNMTIVLVVAGLAVITIQTVTNWTELVSMLMILAVLQGVVYTFSYSAWTMAFLRMVDGRTESKLGQWTTRVINLIQPKQTPG